jgi:hypothetical protein
VETKRMTIEDGDLLGWKRGLGSPPRSASTDSRF